MLVKRRANCCVANAFWTRLKLIWSKCSLKTTKMSKNTFLAQSSGSQWVNYNRNEFSSVKPDIPWTVEELLSVAKGRKCLLVLHKSGAHQMHHSGHLKLIALQKGKGRSWLNLLCLNESFTVRLVVLITQSDFWEPYLPVKYFLPIYFSTC